LVFLKRAARSLVIKTTMPTVTRDAVPRDGLAAALTGAPQAVPFFTDVSDDP
jgi:hypothetical protein